MTAHAIAPVIASSERVSTESLRQLARIEAVRSLRRVSIWIGFVLTILIVSGPTTADWPGDGAASRHWCRRQHERG